ncbi:MAG: hypothetical protein OEZ01_03195 [Candidatus Heimdallarchaeota archaeon]|nr:hypothetical protein [Candidatus Heimdallarchaeota archaeon]MDH5644983.1 hypothetical protein [Candidatus Heimdallarchaeota archaeon]
MSITGYYSQIHFKCNELILFYNLPVVSEDGLNMGPCHHIPNLYCSRAKEFTPNQCIEDRKCEIEELKDELFGEYGIHAPTLKELDKKLRKSK